MTLVSLFLDRIERSEPRQALWIKREGKYQSITWDELAGIAYCFIPNRPEDGG